MSSSLRVLIVDDSDSNANALIAELRSGGYNVISTVVGTTPAIVTALDEPWDIIIASCTMVHVKVHNILKLLHERDVKVPLI
ncbi:MAG: response regulator, partial [Cyanobacteria bacterium]|nr:response regulator [Cyanobacteriota bacterium]